MYSFIIEHFEQHVVTVLLQDNEKFSILRSGHHKFLSYVHLDYHRSTRKMLCHAVEACRNARYSRVQYVSHGIIDFLRALINSISKSVNKSAGDESHLYTLIHGRQTFLPPRNGKDSEAYFPEVRDTIQEHFSVVRGLLLQEVDMYFSANIISHIQQLDSVRIEFELTDRLDRMSERDIAAMSDVNYKKYQEELEEIFHILVDLDQAAWKIDNASRLFREKRHVPALNAVAESGSKAGFLRRIKHDKIMKMSSEPTGREEIVADYTSYPHEKLNDPELDDLRTIPNDANSCEQLLLGLFKEHDKEDLNLNLLHSETFSWNISDENENVPPSQYPDQDPHESEPIIYDENFRTSDEDY